VDALEAEQLDEAREAFLRALELDPQNLDLLADAADLLVNRRPDDDDDEKGRAWLEQGLKLARLGSRQAREGAEPEVRAEFALLEGMALEQLGESREALARVDAALELDPENLDARLERGFALYELCRFAEARKDLEVVVQQAPTDAWAHHTLGLIAERAGNAREARRELERAQRLSPADFPDSTSLSQEEFDAALEDALTAIPEEVRSYLSNVAIAVEELPSIEDLTDSDPPLSPSILGLFRGAAYGQKGSDPWSHFPSSIVLYQKNLERFARDRDDLIEEIGITLVHEVGHFLGLDEEDLWERGLA
jgi:predicted Zn-dependent protease with MMP-like domain/Flp pilus assembly protein TadD